jgi:hypothetical protein
VSPKGTVVNCNSLHEGNCPKVNKASGFRGVVSSQFGIVGYDTVQHGMWATTPGGLVLLALS